MKRDKADENHETTSMNEDANGEAARQVTVDDKLEWKKLRPKMSNSTDLIIKVYDRVETTCLLDNPPLPIK